MVPSSPLSGGTRSAGRPPRARGVKFPRREKHGASTLPPLQFGRLVFLGIGRSWLACAASCGLGFCYGRCAFKPSGFHGRCWDWCLPAFLGPYFQWPSRLPSLGAVTADGIHDRSELVSSRHDGAGWCVRQACDLEGSDQGHRKVGRGERGMEDGIDPRASPLVRLCLCVFEMKGFGGA